MQSGNGLKATFLFLALGQNNLQNHFVQINKIHTSLISCMRMYGACWQILFKDFIFGINDSYFTEQ